MLNLYLTPKSRQSPIPDPDALAAALKFLCDEGIIGPVVGPDEYSSGNHASIFFHSDADQHFLPAELTFDSWAVHQETRECFLPIDQDLAEFDRTVCSVCDEPVDFRLFENVLDRLSILPVERVVYECPCCQSDVPFAELDFGLPTAIARFWFFVEGVIWSRINQSIIDELGKILGFNLMAIPEVIQRRTDGWRQLAHARRRG